MSPKFRPLAPLSSNRIAASSAAGLKVHIALRRAKIAVPCEFLNRPSRRAAHRQMRTERVSQHMHAPIRQVGPPSRPQPQPWHLALAQRSTVLLGQRALSSKVSVIS